VIYLPVKTDPLYYVDENNCWICTTHKQIRVNGIRESIYKYFYIQQYGKIKPNELIIHKCDNKMCCNPEHMNTYLGRTKNIKWKEENGCHIATSHRANSGGYPTIKINKQRIPMHRYMYEQHKGKIPDGMIVRHKCDNRLCINPEHLEIGTHADNVRDRVERNRSAIGIQHGRAKLTENDVRFIRQNTALTLTELGKMFGVDIKSIKLAREFKTWKHVK
jgi:hypothetical protein